MRLKMSLPPSIYSLGNDSGSEATPLSIKHVHERERRSQRFLILAEKFKLRILVPPLCVPHSLPPPTLELRRSPTPGSPGRSERRDRESSTTIGGKWEEGEGNMV